MQDFTISLIQMSVGRDKTKNWELADSLVREATHQGARLVVLPEMFVCPYELDCFHQYAEPLDGSTAEMLSNLSEELKIVLVGGSFPEQDGERVYNTATVWGPNGDRLLVHRKVHLFDIDIPGGMHFQESKKLSPGGSLGIAQTEVAVLGVGICYDLRFPELFRAMAIAGAELLVLPGAFNTTTGPAHWETLLRTRAIENTCFVAACAPAPHAQVSYPSWGHSLVVDPYGDILACTDREQTIVTTNLDPTRLFEVRNALPVLAQRMPKVYAEGVTTITKIENDHR